MLSEVYQVEQPWEGRVQAGRQQGGVAAVGDAQEQARHELWDHGQGTQVMVMLMVNMNYDTMGRAIMVVVRWLWADIY